MSHLACTEHQRRVHMLTEVIIHQSDGSRCDSPTLKAGSRIIEIPERRRKRFATHYRPVLLPQRGLHNA